MWLRFTSVSLSLPLSGDGFVGSDVGGGSAQLPSMRLGIITLM